MASDCHCHFYFLLFQEILIWALAVLAIIKTELKRDILKINNYKRYFSLGLRTFGPSLIHHTQLKVRKDVSIKGFSIN